MSALPKPAEYAKLTERLDAFTANRWIPPLTAGMNSAGDSLQFSEDPEPLPDKLPPVAALNIELLPYELQDWIHDISERMQCPPDFPAVASLVALSSLVGARVVIAPKAQDDLTCSANSSHLFL